MRRLFFMGIGGTLMGSLALLAKELGFDVAGFDGKLYPPMSDQLAEAEVEVFEGFAPEQLEPPPHLVIVGNAKLPRGHPAIEHVLDNNLPYVSGAQWLGEAVLRTRWPIAVAGTHGKTTTASMVAHILHHAGLDPGFMIGGVPGNFGASSRLGSGVHFVVEADEYDTSYFDRRSKFVHYRPRTLVVNNLELDHADIFDDLGQIQTQFNHLLRTVPGNGLVVAAGADENVRQVLDMGCWTPVARFGGEARKDSGDHWQAADAAPDGSRFVVCRNGEAVADMAWSLIGDHNVSNALAALAAAHHAGVPATTGAAALGTFINAKRRLEVIVEQGSLTIYDDFAHHPTAIRATLKGLRARVGRERILAVVEPGTHTMSLGTLRADLANCGADADEVVWFRGPNIRWDVSSLLDPSVVPATVESDIERLVEKVAREAASPVRTHAVLMSNSAFGGIRGKLERRLAARPARRGESPLGLG